MTMNYKEYFLELQENFESWPRALGRLLLKTHEHPKDLYQILRSLPAGSKVLDVGCGTGNSLKYFREARSDLSYIGADAEDHTCFSGDGFEFHKIDYSINQTLLPKADLVTAYFILEHVPQNCIDNFVDNLVSSVNEHGYVFLVCPNNKSIFVDFYDDPTHIRPYTSASMIRLFNRKNCQVVKSGVDRSLLILLLSIIYKPYCVLSRAKSPVSFFSNHLLGTNSFLLLKKTGG